MGDEGIQGVSWMACASVSQEGSMTVTVTAPPNLGAPGDIFDVSTLDGCLKGSVEAKDEKLALRAKTHINQLQKGCHGFDDAISGAGIVVR